MSTTVSEAVPAVLGYSRLLLLLDDLMAKGQGNSPEADEVREQMEKPWYAMTQRERERVGGLSEDLYALTEGSPKSVPMLEEAKLEWAREAKTALRSADPDVTLAFLRRPVPEGMPPCAIPFLQSRQWEKLGDA